VDEETGLTGANRLKEGWLKGKILLNIDSEDDGTFTVGCAGGKDTRIRLPVTFEMIPENADILSFKSSRSARRPFRCGYP
jgi:dipeptidase D